MSEKMQIKYGDVRHECYYRGEDQWLIETYVKDRLDSMFNAGGVYATSVLHDMLSQGIRENRKAMR